MPTDDRLMTVAQCAALTGVTILELRKILKAAPVGISFIVHHTRMVDYRELLAWLKLNPRKWMVGELN